MEGYDAKVNDVSSTEGAVSEGHAFVLSLNRDRIEIRIRGAAAGSDTELDTSMCLSKKEALRLANGLYETVGKACAIELEAQMDQLEERKARLNGSATVLGGQISQAAPAGRAATKDPGVEKGRHRTDKGVAS